MTDAERRLLLAVAACVLADRVPGGPDRERQTKVLRLLLEPFKDFVQRDTERLKAEDEARERRQ